jgi:hypothetical protein
MLFRFCWTGTGRRTGKLGRSKKISGNFFFFPEVYKKSRDKDPGEMFEKIKNIPGNFFKFKKNPTSKIIFKNFPARATTHKICRDSRILRSPFPGKPAVRKKPTFAIQLMLIRFFFIFGVKKSIRAQSFEKNLLIAPVFPN